MKQSIIPVYNSPLPVALTGWPITLLFTTEQTNTPPPKKKIKKNWGVSGRGCKEVGGWEMQVEGGNEQHQLRVSETTHVLRQKQCGQRQRSSPWRSHSPSKGLLVNAQISPVVREVTSTPETVFGCTSPRSVSCCFIYTAALTCMRNAQEYRCAKTPTPTSKHTSS